MNSNGDAAEQIVHITLEGVEYSVRILGHSFNDIARLVKTITSARQTSNGHRMVNDLIKSGKPLMIFSLPSEKLKSFDRIAQRFGIRYCIGMNDDPSDGLVDIVAEKEHSSRIRRIIESYMPSQQQKENIKVEENSPEKKENETEGEYLTRIAIDDQKKTDLFLSDDIPEVFDDTIVKQEPENVMDEIKQALEEPAEKPPRISKRGKKYTHGTRRKKEVNGIDVRKQISDRTFDR